MTSEEKRSLIINSALSRKKKNQYSQDADKRTKIESGYGDCSGTVWYWYHKLFGINIGGNTEAQINSKLGKRVDMTITDGIPDESKLKPADLLYFRGSDNSRTEGVGHVEMYIGNGQCFGHGSGIGGTVKNLVSYCKYRQNLQSTQKLKNKGFICAIRFIPDDVIEAETKEEDKPMTAEEKKEFDKLKGAVRELTEQFKCFAKVFHYTEELPEYPDGTGKTTIQKLMDAGIYSGANKSDLNLPEILMRMLVLNDRAGLYNKWDL